MTSSTIEFEGQFILALETPNGKQQRPSRDQLHRIWPEVLKLRQQLGRILQVEDIEHLIEETN